MHKKIPKICTGCRLELAQPKFTYITVLKLPKLGHIAKSGKQTLLSRSSGPWASKGKETLEKKVRKISQDSEM